MKVVYKRKKSHGMIMLEHMGMDFPRFYAGQYGNQPFRNGYLRIEPVYKDILSKRTHFKITIIRRARNVTVGGFMFFQEELPKSFILPR